MKQINQKVQGKKIAGDSSDTVGITEEKKRNLEGLLQKKQKPSPPFQPPNPPNPTLAGGSAWEGREKSLCQPFTHNPFHSFSIDFQKKHTSYIREKELAGSVKKPIPSNWSYGTCVRRVPRFWLFGSNYQLLIIPPEQWKFRPTVQTSTLTKVANFGVRHVLSTPKMHKKFHIHGVKPVGTR